MRRRTVSATPLHSGYKIKKGSEPYTSTVKLIFIYTQLRDTINHMIIVGITGASGALLGIRCIEELVYHNKQIAVIVSKSAWPIIHHEMQTDCTSIISIVKQRTMQPELLCNIIEYSPDDFFAPIASGSNQFEATIVIPCSMKTVAAIAHGYADNLIHRVCDIALKEKRQLVIVPRETPLSALHLYNLYTLSMYGASVVMPIPAFYNFPETVDDVVNFIIGRVFDQLHIQHNLYRRWHYEEHTR